MTVALSSLRVTADFDASGYTRGMQQKVSADKQGTDSSRAVATALAQQDAQLDNLGRGVAQLSRQYIAGYKEARSFEAGLKSLNTALDRGTIDATRASAIYAGLAQKFDMVGDEARLAAAGMTSLSRVVADSNVHLGRHVAANTNVARAARLSTMQISQMGFQLQDLGVQIASGGGILLPLVQQGSQVATVLGMGPGGLAGGLAALRGSFSALPVVARLALGATGIGGLAVLAASGVGALAGAMSKASNEKAFGETMSANAGAMERFSAAIGEFFTNSATFRAAGDIFTSVANSIAGALNSVAVAAERANAARRAFESGVAPPIGTAESTAAENRRFAQQFPNSGPAYDREYGRRDFGSVSTDNSYDGDSPSELARMLLDPMRSNLERLREEMSRSGDYTQDMLGIQGRLEQAAQDQTGFSRDAVRYQESTASGIVRVYDAAQLGVGATRDGATTVAGSVGSAADRIVRSINGIRVSAPSGGGGGGGGGDTADGGSTEMQQDQAATDAGRQSAEDRWYGGFSDPGFSTGLQAQPLPSGFVYSATGGDPRSSGGSTLRSMSAATYINSMQEQLEHFNRTGFNIWEPESANRMVSGPAASTASTADASTADAASTATAQATADQAAQDRATAEQNARDRSLAELRNPDPYRSLAPDYFYDPSTSAVFREGQAMLTATENSLDVQNSQLAVLKNIEAGIMAMSGGTKPVEMPIPRASVGNFTSSTQTARNAVKAIAPGF